MPGCSAVEEGEEYMQLSEAMHRLASCTTRRCRRQRWRLRAEPSAALQTASSMHGRGNSLARWIHSRAACELGDTSDRRPRQICWRAPCHCPLRGRPFARRAPCALLGARWCCASAARGQSGQKSGHSCVSAACCCCCLPPAKRSCCCTRAPAAALRGGGRQWRRCRARGSRICSTCWCCRLAARRRCAAGRAPAQ
jgi:hypothetical protein